MAVGGLEQGSDREMVLACSGPRALLCLHGRLEPTVEESVRAAVFATEPIAAFLAAVASEIRNIGAFVFAADEGDSVRLLYRGQVEVIVQTSEGRVVLEGSSNVATWNERVVAQAVAVCVKASRVRIEQVLCSMRKTAELEHAAVRTTATASAPEVTLVELPAGDTDAALSDVLAPADAYLFDPGNLFETRLPGSVEVAAIREPADEAPVPTAVPPVDAAPPAPNASLPALPMATAGAPVIASVPGAPPSLVEHGEHDGLTVSPAQLRALRGDLASGASRPVLEPGLTVQAVTCPSGHANSPRTERCRSCSSAITDRTIVLVARPTVGRLQFDNGMTVEVDRRLLIGRKPTVGPDAAVDDLPALVGIPDPEHLLSRVHAEIRLDGWDATVLDNDSRNGTFVVPPGAAEAVRLRPREAFPLGLGTRVLLADVTSFTFTLP